MAGMSASRKPSQSGAVTERLQKQELLARGAVRFGFVVADDVEAHRAAWAFGFEVGFVHGELGAHLVWDAVGPL